MSDNSGQATGEPTSLFWYALPRGYMQMDINPELAQIDSMVEQVLSLPDDVRGRAEQVAQFYAGFLTLLNSQQVQGCAIGLHPRDGDASFSVLTVSTVPTAGIDPKLVLASMARTAPERPDEDIRPLDFPCGTGFLTEAMRRTTAPGRPPEGSEDPLEGTVWQGTVAMTGTGTPDIIMMQLVTAAVDLADDYRNVLLGAASTLTFTDPTLAESGALEKGSLDEASKSPFG
ncbi:hypothetical protein AB0C51_04125 [Streptomyces pathocidini]|uniref:hypothetical protein n=1 Tax=Streptomyces pathocidini TaxID=1650571 RepID=UPI0033FFC65C